MSGQVAEWNPQETLSQVSANEERYSRGFLRCDPGTWFPGLASQWTPLLRSLGIDVRAVSARPSMSPPESFHHSFVASIDGEPLLVGFDQGAAAALCEAFVPRTMPGAEPVVLEYVCRRFVASAAFAWSGVDSSSIKFESTQDASSVDSQGAIEIQGTLNEKAVTVWILGGAQLLDHFDGLWRRQLHSKSTQPDGTYQVQVEIGKLYLPQEQLSQYTRTGASVDLGVPLSDNVTVLASGQPWMNATIAQVDGSFALRVAGGAPAAEEKPAGTVRVSVELARTSIPSSTALELAQVGAMLLLPANVSNQVNLIANDEVIGQARVTTYQGRFALSFNSLYQLNATSPFTPSRCSDAQGPDSAV